MPRNRAMEFAEAALNDFADICRWYADQQVPEIGKRLVGEVVAKVERLIDFSESGRIVPEFGLTNLRELIYPPLRIVYWLDATRIRIVRVWRSDRLLKIPQGNIQPDPADSN